MSPPMIQAESVSDLKNKIRQQPLNEDWGDELGILDSFTHSVDFQAIAPNIFPCNLQRVHDDPPDFLIESVEERIALEVTRITAPQFEVFLRKRPDGGTYTSTMLGGEPNKSFHQKLDNFCLPDDSRTKPCAVNIADANYAYHEMAMEIISKKLKALSRYRSNHSKAILLIQDKLSSGPFLFTPRVNHLRQWITFLKNQVIFDQIIVMDTVRTQNGIPSACLIAS
jgi:hypothetical protein